MSKDISCFAEIFGTIPDPRSKQGTDLPFTGILAIVFFGLLAGQNYFAHIQRWTFNHWSELKVPLGFKKSKPPHATTLSRLLSKIRLGDLQDAFVTFLSRICEDEPLVASVDGKVSKQILDKDGEVLQMLNVFVHNMKITLMEWSVKGDKTNESGCLKQHLHELLQNFPQLKILTGDAIFANRPLLQVLKENAVDYVFQVKENQPEILDAMKETFRNIESTEPVSRSFSKKKAA